jgi:hypothetical protein
MIGPLPIINTDLMEVSLGMMDGFNSDRLKVLGPNWAQRYKTEGKKLA